MFPYLRLKSPPRRPEMAERSTTATKTTVISPWKSALAKSREM